MSFRGVKTFLLACCGASALLARLPDANAGGLAIREQSAYAQGSSFAGSAAGGYLSAMFWNPATLTQMPGIQSEFSASAIFPYAVNNVGAGSTLAGYGGTGDTADDAFVPSAYLSWQLSQNLWLGMGINSPFGLAVSFPDVWAGRNYGGISNNLHTYNANPTIAYRINDLISVGVGVQVEYAKASLMSGIGSTPAFVSSLSGTGWAYGFTAGITLTPTPDTTIGLGYRSALNQKIDGTLATSGPIVLFGTTNGSINTTLKLPDIVSLGIRQRLGPQWTLLGTAEWSNWSRIGTSNVVTGSGAQATIGGVPVMLPFQYKDGWFFSGGAEYQWDQRLTLRGGAGYEISPIADDVRIPLVPDNDRIWLSMGASYKVSRDLSLDLAYSHAWVKSTPINVVPGNPWFDGISYVGDVSAHFDIFSVALRYRWDSGGAPRKAN